MLTSPTLGAMEDKKEAAETKDFSSAVRDVPPAQLALLFRSISMHQLDVRKQG